MPSIFLWFVFLMSVYIYICGLTYSLFVVSICYVKYSDRHVDQVSKKYFSLSDSVWVLYNGLLCPGIDLRYLRCVGCFFVELPVEL